jgi:hypothetical protein
VAANLRYASNSDRILRRSEMTLCAKSGLMRRSKWHSYSITSSARTNSALLCLDHLGQLLTQLRAIVMTMHCDRVLHRRVYKLFFRVG